MAFFENFFWLLVLIGVMILIHEWGHFAVARFFNVRVEVFSFGFGPRLFGFRRGDTDYRFSAILFGGYVKMYGEQAGDEIVQHNAESAVNASSAQVGWTDCLWAVLLLVGGARVFVSTRAFE